MSNESDLEWRERVQGQLNRIETQTTETNGRVGRLEDATAGLKDESERVHTDLYGDQERGVAGLIAKAAGTDEMMDEWRQLRHTINAALTFAKWFTGLFMPIVAGLVVFYVTQS